MTVIRIQAIIVVVRLTRPESKSKEGQKGTSRRGPGKGCFKGGSAGHPPVLPRPWRLPGGGGRKRSEAPGHSCFTFPFRITTLAKVRPFPGRRPDTAPGGRPEDSNPSG